MIDLSVVGEATHGGDVLLNGIVSAGGVVLDTSLSSSTNAVNLVVDLGSGVVAALTGASHSPLDGSWMPGTDTSNLAKTSVSLSSEFFGTESLDDTLSSLTLGDTDGINALVAFENFTNGDFLFELAPGPVNFLCNSSTVNLDFQDLSLVLS